MAGGGGVELHVGVGGVGALGVSVEIGPATAVGGDLDLVAGDGGAAGVDRGGPGEVDPGRPVGGRGQPGGRAGRGEGDEPDADVGAGGPGEAGRRPDPASAALDPVTPREKAREVVPSTRARVSASVKTPVEVICRLSPASSIIPMVWSVEPSVKSLSERTAVLLH